MHYSEEEIQLEDLRVDCIIGVHPYERETEQPLVISVGFGWDFGPAAASEALERTVDYGQVGRSVRAFVVEGRFHLLETLARRLGAHLLEQFPMPWVRLKIRKPKAVADSDGACVSLLCRREPEGT